YKFDGKERIDILELATMKVLKTLMVPKTSGLVDNLRWRNNDTLGYSIDEINAKDSIWSHNLHNRSPRLLQDFNDADIMDLRFSADDKHIAFIRGEWKHDAFLLTYRNEQSIANR